VLPTPGVTRGPAACGCFSQGRWELDNTSPCFVTYAGGAIWAVSTYLTGPGATSCPTTIGAFPPPQPQPGVPWSPNRLTVDCAGQFRLCYTIKAGDPAMPAPTDCVVAESCIEAWYPEANVTQDLPPLPGWSGTDPACAAAFRNGGGYGEMSVVGRSIECENIDDMGEPFVFNRIPYCSFECSQNPTLPGCEGCRPDGSGSF
jgi:hypothetical protein